MKAAEQRDESFEALCDRVRAHISMTQGAHDAKPFLLLLDLIELLYQDETTAASSRIVRGSA